MIAKLGLDDWKMALPAGLFVAIPTLGNEVLVLDAETQLVACFVLFCSTMYTQLGGMVAKSLDEYRDNVYTTLKKVDESMLVDINASIAANEKVLNMEADVKSMHDLMDDMAVTQADALNYAEEHKYRDAVVKKLDSLVAIEEAAVSAMRVRMLTSVQGKVVNKFSTDAKAKDAALANALSVLSSGKIGKDVVGEIYGAALQEYRTEYSKTPKGGDAILAQLEKDIASACSAPAIDATGGNVYETHPINSK